MQTADIIKAKLGAYMSDSKGDMRIKDWCMEISELRSVNIGLKDNTIGGVYTCPNFKEETVGQLYIIWNDDRRTIAKLDSKTPNTFEEQIQVWRKSSFIDEVGAQLIEPQKIPEVKLYDPAIEEITEGNDEIVFNILKRYKDILGCSVQKIDAHAGAGAAVRAFENSKGLSVEYKDTSLFTYVSADNIYFRGYSKRKLIDKETLDYIVEDVKKTAGLLKQRGRLKSGNMDIILMPSVAESFVRNYLVNNAYGSAVANNKSAFTLEQFKNNSQIFRDDFDLFLDTVRDYGAGSYLCNYEGIASGRLDIIREGKLISPIVSLKYSKKTGFPPTTSLKYDEGYYFRLKNMRKLEDIVGNTENGIIVYSILGMHTQPHESGDYSITCPECLKIEKGRVTEAVKTVISGNFFRDLKNSSTEFALVDNEDNPAIKIKSFAAGE